MDSLGLETGRRVRERGLVVEAKPIQVPDLSEGIATAEIPIRRTGERKNSP